MRKSDRKVKSQKTRNTKGRQKKRHWHSLVSLEISKKTLRRHNNWGGGRGYSIIRSAECKLSQPPRMCPVKTNRPCLSVLVWKQKETTTTTLGEFSINIVAVLACLPSRWLMVISVAWFDWRGCVHTSTHSRGISSITTTTVSFLSGEHPPP